MPPASQAFSPPQQQFQQSSSAIGSPSGGFGDTGNSSVRVSNPSGGRNAMGSSFGWAGESSGMPAAFAPPSRNQPLQPTASSHMPDHMQTTSSMKLAIGAQVLYRQMGKMGMECDAVIIDIEPVGSRFQSFLFSANACRRTITVRVSARGWASPVPVYPHFLSFEC